MEEVVAGNLYTGPMYLKYNTVLRSFSGDAFMVQQCVKYKLGTSAAEEERFSLAPTKYATTIYAINSLIVKGSKLTVVTPVFRGIAAMRLPQSMLTPNEDGVSGGAEYGFSSTTCDLKTARFYAKTDKADVASTVIEVEMGQIDRGSDVSWLSQFPHESEVLVRDASLRRPFVRCPRRGCMCVHRRSCRLSPSSRRTRRASRCVTALP